MLVVEIILAQVLHRGILFTLVDVCVCPGSLHDLSVLHFNVQVEIVDFSGCR